jgi:hypothetical protein
MAGPLPVDLRAARELRVLVDNLGHAVPSVETVRAIDRAARRAGDRRWMRWACRIFDDAHHAEGCCA